MYNELLVKKGSYLLLFCLGLIAYILIPFNNHTHAQINSSNSYNLAFSTYLGGSAYEQARDVAVDDQGNIYVVGGTASVDFPRTLGEPLNYNVNSTACTTIAGSNAKFDVFITKYSPAGAVLWSRLLGGHCYDRAYAVEVDNTGVYVGGRAGEGFPTGQYNNGVKNSNLVVQPSFGGPFTTPPQSSAYGQQDAFVAKLNSANGQIIWSTYFGSSDNSFARDIDIDASGNVYLAVDGVLSTNPYVPGKGVFQTSLGGDNDMIVAKISPDGKRVVFATYYGGNGDDGYGPSIRVDNLGYSYIVGGTTSTNLPITDKAYQKMLRGIRDNLVAKFSPDGSSLIYGTYLGGSGEDAISGTHNLFIDDNGAAYITGFTNSSDLWPAGIPEWQKTFSGNPYDGFTAKLSSDGSKVLAGTYHVGGQGISVDDTGVYLSDYSNTNSFPVTSDAYQRNYSGGANDGILVKLSLDLKTLLYATYLGGAGDDQFRSSTIDKNGNIIIVGHTDSANFPLLNCKQAQCNYGGATDNFVAKFNHAPSSVFFFRLPLLLR